MVYREHPFADIGGDQLPRVFLKTDESDFAGSMNQGESAALGKVEESDGVRGAVADGEQGAIRGDIEIHRIGREPKLPVNAHRLKGQSHQLAGLAAEDVEIAVRRRKP